MRRITFLALVLVVLAGAIEMSRAWNNYFSSISDEQLQKWIVTDVEAEVLAAQILVHECIWALSILLVTVLYALVFRKGGLAFLCGQKTQT